MGGGTSEGREWEEERVKDGCGRTNNWRTGVVGVRREGEGGGVEWGKREKCIRE